MSRHRTCRTMFLLAFVAVNAAEVAIEKSSIQTNLKASTVGSALADSNSSNNTWDCMSELHPKINGVQLLALSASAFDGVSCNETESRCFVVTDAEILSVLLPGGIARETGNDLLISWDYMKLLPPSWYTIVVEMPGSNLVGRPTRYMAVPEDRLKLDGYPGTGEIGSLRLVLYPSTWRFFMMGLHVPMLVEGAWPTATQVMQRGFILREKTRDELAALLDVGCPPSDFAEWCPLFREALISRHWPTPCVNVVSPAIELGSLEAPALQEGVFAGVDTAAMAEPTSCADVHNNAFVDSEDFPTHANNQLGACSTGVGTAWAGHGGGMGGVGVG